MKNKITPIFALVVLFALVFTMAYFGQHEETTNTVAEQSVGEVTETENVKKVVPPPREKTITVTPEDIQMKFVETPELTLTYVGEAVSNNYNYATLDRYSEDEYTLQFTISTDVSLEDMSYEVIDGAGNVLYKGTEGLSGGSSGGDLHTISLNKICFDGNPECDAPNLKPEWKELKKKFYLHTGYDTTIIVEV